MMHSSEGPAFPYRNHSPPRIGVRDRLSPCQGTNGLTLKSPRESEKPLPGLHAILMPPRGHSIAAHLVFRDMVVKACLVILRQ